MRLLLCFALLFCLTACDQAEEPAPPPVEEAQKPPEFVLTPASFNDLPEWGADDFEGFAQGFARSCLRFMKNQEDKPFGVMGKDHTQSGTYGDWQEVCKKFARIKDPAQIQVFFEANFTPYQVSANDEPLGTFTGYYEASLRGSRHKTERYNIPLHKRPKDLVMVNLGEFREELKGTRIAGRVKDGLLKPYEPREQIVNGDWPHKDESNILLWVDDAVDAFFVQIQGSGLVEMDDGSLTRIGYDGQNGHVYYAIGRELVKREELPKEQVSMQSIRKWLAAHPDQADEIMNTNKSYVFFREIIGEGPLGAEGIALTPLRSLAIDRTLISYGTPVWLSTSEQFGVEEEDGGTVLRERLPAMNRMMIAQDTGGAIQGPVRGDVFWGHGEKAEAMAGVMNAKGRYWVMLPKALKGK
jgi:membrane-bound lytic murein transglycosylase A